MLGIAQLGVSHAAAGSQLANGEFLVEHKNPDSALDLDLTRGFTLRGIESQDFAYTERGVFMQVSEKNRSFTQLIEFHIEPQQQVALVAALGSAAAVAAVRARGASETRF